MKRLSNFFFSLMAHLCEITNHMGECGFLNYEWYLFYDHRLGEHRMTLKNPVYHLYRWAEAKSSRA